jgi:serine/threonine protein kinase
MEILLGMRDYGPAVDIWGVGCILAELFTGRPILQGGRADAVNESENDLDQFIEIAKVGAAMPNASVCALLTSIALWLAWARKLGWVRQAAMRPICYAERKIYPNAAKAISKNVGSFTF